MRRAAFIVLVLLWSAPAAADGRFAAALAGLNVLGVADGALTVTCLRAGTCVEQGPLYRPLAGRPAVLGAVKAASMTGLSVALWKLHKRKPKTAWALTAALIAGQAYVVRHNWQATR